MSLRGVLNTIGLTAFIDTFFTPYDDIHPGDFVDSFTRKKRRNLRKQAATLPANENNPSAGNARKGVKLSTATPKTLISDVLPGGASLALSKQQDNVVTPSTLFPTWASGYCWTPCQDGSQSFTNVFVNNGRIYYAVDHPFNLDQAKGPTSVKVGPLSTSVKHTETKFDDAVGLRYSVLPAGASSDLLSVKVPFVAPLTGEAVARVGWRWHRHCAGSVRGPNPPLAPYRAGVDDEYPYVVVGKVLEHGLKSPFTLDGLPSAVRVSTASWWGDCGSPYISPRGIVAVHIAAGGPTYNLAKAVVGASRNQAIKSPIPGAQSAYYGSLKPAQRSRFQSKLVRKGPASKAEAALYDVAAPSSDYIGPGKNANGSLLERYTTMLTNPWSGSMCRLPDVNIAPTCLAKFYANRTFTLTGENQDTAFVFGLNSRLGCYDTQAPLDNVSAYYPSTSQTSVPPYTYAPGTILSPQSVTGGVFSPLTGSPAGPWSDDFGPEQTSTTSWVSSYRTLAMAVRVRVVGLPTGVFMAPGKLYFAQIRYDASDMPVTEQDFVVLERLGRATHVSLDAVREGGSKTFFAVPDSADKFNLSSAFFLPPGVFPQNLLPGGGGQNYNGAGLRLFPGYANIQGERVVIPYDAITDRTPASVAGTMDSTVADSTMVIVCGVFGASGPSSGTVLEVNYGMVVEYIPSAFAPPGLETQVQLPDSISLDRIFAATAVASELRPVMVQAPGDLTVSTPGPSSVPASVERAKRVVGAMSQMSSRAAGRQIPHSRREGWFDWLGDVDLNIGGWHLGNTGSPDKPKKKKDKK